MLDNKLVYDLILFFGIHNTIRNKLVWLISKGARLALLISVFFSIIKTLFILRSPREKKAKYKESNDEILKWVFNLLEIN